MPISRRGLLAGIPLLLSGCVSFDDQSKYAALPNEKYPLKPFPVEKIKPQFRRQEVAYETKQPAGTVVIDTPARHAYYVLGNGRAVRYGVGVGRAGLALAGDAYVGRKAEWPHWTPTAAMRAREERYRNMAGMAGGPNNPLGARAMYLYRNGGDTMFRLHGTNEPQSIGLAMSSGCVRFMNHDVIDLYNRVKVGAKVVVIQA